MTTDFEQATILLIEDDPGHQRLVEKNLRRANITNPILMLGDGQEAIEYVLQRRKTHLRHPVLVILDLNVPGLDGYQVLQRLKADQKTRSIPVIVLTTADDDLAVARCYELGCNLFITKPVDYEQFSTVIRRLGLLLPSLALPIGG